MGCVDRQWSALLASSVTSFLVVVVVLCCCCCCCLLRVMCPAMRCFCFSSSPFYCCCCCCCWDCDDALIVMRFLYVFFFRFAFYDYSFWLFLHCYAVVTPRRNVMRKRPRRLRRVNVTQHRIRWRFHFRLYFGIESYKHLSISLSLT